MIYSKLAESLIEAVPGIRFRYEQELREWRGNSDRPGPHIIFGDVLLPAILEDLESGRKTELLRQTFAFLEKMAASNDPDIRDVVGQAIGEQLCERSDFQRARKMMGRATIAVIEKACDLRHRRRH